MKSLTITEILTDYRQYLTAIEVNDLERMQIFLSNIGAGSLKLALFGEEWNYMTAEKSNPWSDEYIDRVNRKRNAFGVSPVNGSCFASDNSSDLFCEEVVRKTNNHDKL